MLHSSLEIEGIWDGWVFPQTPTELKNTPLDELLIEILARRPEPTDAIRQQERHCRALLLKIKDLSVAKIRELLAFTGTAQELADKCQQARLPAGTVFHPHSARQALERLRSLRVEQAWTLLREGALIGPAQPAFHHYNKVLYQFGTLVDGILRTLIPGSITGSDIGVAYCRVGACATAPDSAQDALLDEVDTVPNLAPAASLNTGLTSSFLFSYGLEEGNGTVASIESATNASKFRLSGSGNRTRFKAASLILVTGPTLAAGGEIRKIQSGPTSDTDPDQNTYLTEPLSATPTGGTATLIWAEAGLETGSGLLLTRSLFDEPFPKTNALGIMVQAGISLRFVGA